MDTPEPNLNTSAAVTMPGAPYVWQDPVPTDPAVPADVTPAVTSPRESPRAALIRRAATIGVAGAGLVAAVAAGKRLAGAKTAAEDED